MFLSKNLRQSPFRKLKTERSTGEELGQLHPHKDLEPPVLGKRDDRFRQTGRFGLSHVLYNIHHPEEAGPDTPV